MTTTWQQVTEWRNPASWVRTGAWQDFEKMRFNRWCERHGEFMLRRNPGRNRDCDIRTDDRGRISLWAERS